MAGVKERVIAHLLYEVEVAKELLHKDHSGRGSDIPLSRIVAYVEKQEPNPRKRIARILILRDITGISLREAKDALTGD